MGKPKHTGYLVGLAHYLMAALSLVADPACWMKDRGDVLTVVTPGLVVGTVLFVVASFEQVGGESGRLLACSSTDRFD